MLASRTHIAHHTKSLCNNVRRPCAPLVRRRELLPPKKRVVVRNVSPMVEMSYYVGQTIILFTMFYCGLNWWYYRGLRKRMEDDEHKK